MFAFLGFFLVEASTNFLFSLNIAINRILDPFIGFSSSWILPPMDDFPILALFPKIHRQDEPDIVVLWSWAYMKELLAACKGKKLKEREIEARIQHFLSVLKVTLLKSTQVDFASESWKQDYRKYTVPNRKLGNDSQTCPWEHCSQETQWEYYSKGQPLEFRQRQWTLCDALGSFQLSDV